MPCAAASAPEGNRTIADGIVAPWSDACCADGFVCIAGGSTPTCQADPYPYVPPALQRPNLTLALPPLPAIASFPATGAAAAMTGISSAYPSMSAVSTRLVAANAAPSLLPYLKTLNAKDPFTRDLASGVLPNLGLTAGPNLPTTTYNLLNNAETLVRAQALHPSQSSGYLESPQACSCCMRLQGPYVTGAGAMLAASPGVARAAELLAAGPLAADTVTLAGLVAGPTAASVATTPAPSIAPAEVLPAGPVLPAAGSGQALPVSACCNPI